MNEALQFKDYHATIRFSSEDEVFHGKIFGINDLVTFEGTSVKELKKAFREAVEDYIKTCQESGREPDKTFKGTFNVRIPVQLHKDAAVYAAVHNISLNDFVRSAIGFALQRPHELEDYSGRR
ncbi:type II toxin-antitoxin system HicB family antitoxin [Chitinophaga sp.]|uniref:type II toxin-antitoxin system HicB family antitoxin n=1 Tax=Chitinophaga sp. TaxID=1869181 RepID=UPI002613E87A|nr:type II toxin-antitoxin system HicB family antitoxin [uncultured Chitinophaga sp.]